MLGIVTASYDDMIDSMVCVLLLITYFYILYFLQDKKLKKILTCFNKL
jgi:hypothetical protein